MKTLAPDMLQTYRATTTPEFREHVDAFKAMSEADQRELLFYVSAYMANQYAALLNLLHSVPPKSERN